MKKFWRNMLIGVVAVPCMLMTTGCDLFGTPGNDGSDGNSGGSASSSSALTSAQKTQAYTNLRNMIVSESYISTENTNVINYSAVSTSTSTGDFTNSGIPTELSENIKTLIGTDESYTKYSQTQTAFKADGTGYSVTKTKGTEMPEWTVTAQEIVKTDGTDYKSYQYSNEFYESKDVYNVDSDYLVKTSVYNFKDEVTLDSFNEYETYEEFVTGIQEEALASFDEEDLENGNVTTSVNLILSNEVYELKITSSANFEPSEDSFLLFDSISTNQSIKFTNNELVSIEVEGDMSMTDTETTSDFLSTYEYYLEDYAEDLSALELTDDNKVTLKADIDMEATYSFGTASDFDNTIMDTDTSDYEDNDENIEVTFQVIFQDFDYAYGWGYYGDNVLSTIAENAEYYWSDMLEGYTIDKVYADEQCTIEVTDTDTMASYAGQVYYVTLTEVEAEEE